MFYRRVPFSNCKVIHAASASCQENCRQLVDLDRAESRSTLLNEGGKTPVTSRSALSNGALLFRIVPPQPALRAREQKEESLPPSFGKLELD